MINSKKNINYALSALLVANSLFVLTSAQLARASHGDAIPGHYIVVLKEYPDHQMNDVVRQSLEEAGITSAQILGKLTGLTKGFHGKFNSRQLETLKRDPRVRYIEQDREIHLEPNKGVQALGAADPIPTQPAQMTGWGAARVGHADATGKTAWVIDSGIRPDHPDLNVDMNRSASFITGVTSVIDGYGHGTGVAGIIAAKNNDIGMVGVASGASIVALRVFDDYGRGSTSSAIKAVNYVIAYGSAGDVVNMSLGGGISSTLDNAIISAASKGIYFALAAGNSAVDCINNSPARVNGPNIYTVSSMNSAGALSSFSNFGASVDFAAPGEGIYTTSHSGGYGSGSGTSFAAPHVAGLLLLRGKVATCGFITGDKDGSPDPIACLSQTSAPAPTPTASPTPSPSPSPTAAPTKKGKGNR